MSPDPSPSTTQSGNIQCANCGASFACGVETGDCWCFETSQRVAMPERGNAACLCPKCFDQLAAAEAKQPEQSGHPV